MEVMAEAASLGELPGMGALRESDVLVLDADAMLGTGRMTYDRLDEWLPALKVLFLGSRDDANNLGPEDLPAYMQLNTVGFMLKDGPTSRLVDGIRLISVGTFVCEMELIRHMLTRLSHWAMLTDESTNGQQLSSRELEVLEMVVKGASNKEIAKELFLSEGTVKAHVSHIMAKVNVERRTDLVRHALTKGMVRVAEGENGYR
jgi:DNA-binding NarL/FixJ family response regulator